MNINVELLQLYRCTHLVDLLNRTGLIFEKVEFEYLSLDWIPGPATPHIMQENLSPVWDNYDSSVGPRADLLREQLSATWTTILTSDVAETRPFLEWQFEQIGMMCATHNASPVFERQSRVLSNHAGAAWTEYLSHTICRERDRVLLLTAKTQSPMTQSMYDSASVIFDTFVAAYRYLHSQSIAVEVKPVQPSLNSPLSRREIECLQWLAVGKTISEAACILGISERTLRFHVTNARERLGVSTTMQAVVAAALRYGFDPNDPRLSIYTASRRKLNSFA
ncbi:MAG: LuxR C-terminal-related transcriptional regulator [Pseudomonadota bacterium]